MIAVRIGGVSAERCGLGLWCGACEQHVFYDSRIVFSCYRFGRAPSRPSATGFSTCLVASSKRRIFMFNTETIQVKYHSPRRKNPGHCLTFGKLSGSG